MRAVVSHAPGGLETLRLTEMPAPEAGPGELLIDVTAVGVNFPDVLIIEDRYQFRPERPFAPGAELAGTVAAAGPGVSGFAAGRPVMALPMWGGMAERVAVAAERCHPLPDGFDLSTAAALQMTYGTALHGLVERAALRRDDRVLVLGAAGGVGLAAVEIAAALGAHVVAAASSQEKLAVAREHGAAEGVVYGTGAMDRDAVRALSRAFREALGGEGADVVFDPVGGDHTEAALRACAWQGRHLVVGFPAGIAKVPTNLVLLKGCDVRGVFWGEAVRRDLAGHHRAMDELLAMCADGRLRPRIEARYPLAEASAAIAALAARSVRGKVIVTID